MNCNNIVKYYEIYLNGKKVDKVNNEKASIKLSNDEHQFSVTAVDRNGNKSSMSNLITIKKINKDYLSDCMYGTCIQQVLYFLFY